MAEFDRPWQVTASKLISHAKEHAKKNTDFDKQMAYLLVDVGVETLFKAYLTQHAYKEYQNELRKKSRELNFHDLNLLVMNNTGEALQGIKVDEADYFHNKRNQIYHQGDGVAPTMENLDRYLELAQKLLSVLLEVDLNEIEFETENDKYIISFGDRKRSIDDLYDELKAKMEYFQFNCAILTEYLSPRLATYKVAIKLADIWESLCGNVSTDRVDDPINKTIKRLFKKFTGIQLENLDFIEFLVQNPSRLHIWRALEDISENLEDELNTFQMIANKMDWLDNSWKREIDDNRLEKEEIYNEYKMINSWFSFHQERIDKRLKEIYPDVLIRSRSRFIGFSI